MPCIHTSYKCSPSFEFIFSIFMYSTLSYAKDKIKKYSRICLHPRATTSCFWVWIFITIPKFEGHIARLLVKTLIPSHLTPTWNYIPAPINMYKITLLFINAQWDKGSPKGYALFTMGFLNNFITLLRSITLFYETDSIMRNILHIQHEWRNIP